MSHWIPVSDGDARARALYLRHYSARHYKDNRVPCGEEHAFDIQGEKP